MREVLFEIRLNNTFCCSKTGRKQAKCMILSGRNHAHTQGDQTSQSHTQNAHQGTIKEQVKENQKGIQHLRDRKVSVKQGDNDTVGNVPKNGKGAAH